MNKTTAVLAAMVVSTGFIAGCGSSDRKAANQARTVNVEMRDNSYQPTEVTVKAGETIHFVFHNQGKVLHDAYLGDEAAQMNHERQMMDNSGMHHADRDAIAVGPGKTGELTHTFTSAQSVLIGCHQPGHYAAGMKLTVDVS